MTRDSKDSGLVMMTAAAIDNGGLRQLRRTAMAVDDDGMQELAADNDGQGTRPGGEQRWHSAFSNRGNIINK